MSLSELCQRSSVVAEARKWIKTPYHPQGDILGVGVDCGMLLVRVFVDTSLCDPFDPRPYSDDWYMHRSEEKYLGFVFDRARQVIEPHLGDVMLFRYGRCYAHGGIVTEIKPLKIVHAFQQARMVIEEEVARNPVLSERRRSPKFFSYWAGA
jgi:cell wall-associated NlpC family hydrolase